tara:strand:+ start:6874 stop:7758 length:885 start_codon:yes stop_codon:yes gene_type:complete
MIQVVDTPQQWIPKNTFAYPPHQGLNPLIEERAFSYFTTMDIDSDYLYIPIQWTQYHCSHNWGNDAASVAEMQRWADELPKKYPDKKFFTVVQYDDGTLVSIDNCKVFAASNSPKSPRADTQEYIPIPLLSDPHPSSPKEQRMNKVGFVGRNDTHSMRKILCDKLMGTPDYRFEVNHSGGNMSQLFRDVIQDSVFGLAPRGYGPTSFRLYETMQLGSIPIYISDVFWLPFEDVIDWEKAALLVHSDDIDTIPAKVDAILDSGEYENYLEYGRMVYEKYLTWDGTLNQIANIISK